MSGIDRSLCGYRWKEGVAAGVTGFGSKTYMFISSDGLGVSALSADMVMYIEEGAEEGGALDDEEQEDDAEEDDEVDVSVVAEIFDSGSEISRFCRKLLSRLSLLVVAVVLRIAVLVVVRQHRFYKSFVHYCI